MVFRINKNSNYTVMSNYHLREKNMSLKAKGLLSWMLSNDDSWDYSIAGIVASCKENESAIKSTLKELQEFGYLEIIKKNPDENIPTIHYEYLVYEQPKQIDSQEGDFLHLENLTLENPTQRNTKTRNTNKEDILSKDKIYEPVPGNEFLGSLKRKPKKSLYAECVSYIRSFTSQIDIQELLIKFLDSLVEQQKLKGKVQFQGILKKLDSYNVSKEQLVDIINYSIEHGYATFYDISKQTYKTSNGASDTGRHSVHQTPEQKEQLRKDIANGKAEKF